MRLRQAVDRCDQELGSDSNKNLIEYGSQRSATGRVKRRGQGATYRNDDKEHECSPLVERGHLDLFLLFLLGQTLLEATVALHALGLLERAVVLESPDRAPFAQLGVAVVDMALGVQVLVCEELEEEVGEVDDEEDDRDAARHLEDTVLLDLGALVVGKRCIVARGEEYSCRREGRSVGAARQRRK